MNTIDDDLGRCSNIQNCIGMFALSGSLYVVRRKKNEILVSMLVLRK